MLVLGLLAAFLYAAYLSYNGSADIRNAFEYQSAVVRAQRDSDVLATIESEPDAPPAEVRRYRSLLAFDLGIIDRRAQKADERSPRFVTRATAADYDRLGAQLDALRNRGELRFERTVVSNRRTRDYSNALFAFVALLFAVVVGRLRNAVAEGRSLVGRLQRAFISRRRDLPNLELGSVLLSATRGSNVGGDTHDAFTLDPRYGMLLVADVSGKGIDAAVDTALIKYSVRTLFADERDPGIILAKFARLYASSAENPETFVVMFLAVVDLLDGTVRYASAGHEPAWSIVDGAVSVLAPTGPIVGIEDQPVYETRELRLRRGDGLVISTDGLTESRDARGNLLGAAEVAAWISEFGGTAQGIADAIVRRLRRRSSRITDDLAILVARYVPAAVADSVTPVASAAATVFAMHDADA